MALEINQVSHDGYMTSFSIVLIYGGNTYAYEGEKQTDEIESMILTLTLHVVALSKRFRTFPHAGMVFYIDRNVFVVEMVAFDGKTIEIAFKHIE